MYIQLQIPSETGVQKVKLEGLSKNMQISELQEKIEVKTGVPVGQQKLIHKGKILSGQNRETLLHYSINYNETVQVFQRVALESLPVTSNNQNKEVEPEKEKVESLVDAHSKLYKIGDLVDVKDNDEGSDTIGAFFEAKIVRITKIVDPDPAPGDVDDDGLNYHIVYDQYPNDDTDYKILVRNLRPRARRLVKLGDISKEQRVLVNYNQRDPEKVGEWYEASVDLADARKKKLVVTLFVGVDATPLPETTISQLDQVFLTEKPVPCDERTESDKKELQRIVARRHTVECEQCQDNDAKRCKKCGCNKCGKKDNPGELVICDECQLNFHIKCIGLKEIPEDDFYCKDCKREDTTIKPGDKIVRKKLENAPSQTKVQKRDWGKGFACAGRTKTNDKVDAKFKGPIPGTEVGMTWRYRIQLSEVGIMRPPVAGIHATELGAMSIVLNGGYEDNKDEGDEFTYVGSGGRDLDGNKRTNVQSFDQELTNANKGLAVNCAAPFNLDGGDAGADWKKGQPVRVVRGQKLRKSSKFAPVEGFRYDGIYKVVKYYKEKGQSKFFMWKYLLRRDDPAPAPWTKEGQAVIEERGWKVINPDGYEPPKSKSKKRKADETATDKENSGPPPAKTKKYELSSSLKKLIKEDKHNSKVWSEFLKQRFPSHDDMTKEVERTFECNVCMGCVTAPVKLACRHNMCETTCYGRLLKLEEEARKCPSCRASIKGDEEKNPELEAIIDFVIPGLKN